MKKTILLIFILSYFTNFAQTKFEKGYFINNSGKRVECYIELLDLFYTPTTFNYKISKEGKKIKASIKEVKTFEIYNNNNIKYERHQVDIDRSSEIIDNLSNGRKAIFNKEQLFLKPLIKGKASLYQYTEPNLNRFFFKKENSKLQQLVFKSYTNGFDRSIKKNERYKQQLMNSLVCEDLKKVKFNNLKYRKNNLTSLFIDYNNCEGADYENYSFEKKKKLKTQFNLNINAGTRLIDFSATSSIFFQQKLTARFGVETELVLPIYKNKWSLVFEPNYVYYNARYDDLITLNLDNVNDILSTINYSAIDLPLGLRYYILFNNKNFKFFINAFIVPSYTLSLKTESNNENSSFSINENNRFSFSRSLGIGYKYLNKFSVEFRGLGGNRNLLNLNNENDFFGSSSIILGYIIF